MSQDGVRSLRQWEEALEWYSTLRDAQAEALTDGLGRRWQDWCANPMRERLFDDMSYLLASSGLNPPGRRSKEELDEDQYDLSISIAEWQEKQSHKVTGRRRSGVRNGWWLPATIAAAGLAVLFLVAPLRFGSSAGASTTTVYQTAIGRLEEVNLSDGTKIVLGARTKLSVAISTRRRTVALLEGQAWFKVAHYPHWPFVVSAGDDTITDLGTAFVVTRNANRVVIAVTEGTVEVSDRPRSMALRLARAFDFKPTFTSIHLNRGEALIFGDKAAPNLLQHTDISAATSWAHGSLTFDDQELSAIVDTVNRYSKLPIRVSPAAGALRLSTVLPEDQLDRQDIDSWTHSLKDILPIAVQRRSSSICIELRGEPQGSRGFCGTH